MAIEPIMDMVNDELFSNLMEEKKVAAIVKKTPEASKTVSYGMLELLASRMSKAMLGPMLSQLLGKYWFYLYISGPSIYDIQFLDRWVVLGIIHQ